MKVLTTVAAAAAVAATLAAPAHAGCATVRTRGRWTTADLPYTGSGASLQPIYAAGATPAELFVTDGTVIQRSDNGGCTWHEVFRLDSSKATTPDLDAAVGHGTRRTIETLVVAPPAGARAIDSHTAVYAVLYGVERESTVLAMSADDGRTWRTSIVQADCLGTGQKVPVLLPKGIAAAGPRTVYLLANGGYKPDRVDPTLGVSAANPAVASHLLVSTDGGGAWTCVPQAFVGGEADGRLATAPDDPRTAWNVNCRNVARTTDGGAHWTRFPVPWAALSPQSFCNAYPRAVDVRRVGGSHELTVLIRGNAPGDAQWTGDPHVYQSRDNGRTWRELARPVIDIVSQEPIGLVVPASGEPLVIVGEGIASPSIATGFTLRAWSDRRRAWTIVSTVPVSPGPKCGRDARLEWPAGTSRGDASAVTLTVRAQMREPGKADCASVVVRYRAG